MHRDRVGPHATSSRARSSGTTTGAGAGVRRTTQASGATRRTGTGQQATPGGEGNKDQAGQVDAGYSPQWGSRNVSLGEAKRSDRRARSPEASPTAPPQEDRGLFHTIEQLAAAEAALWSILDGLKSNATHMSYFCREYWGTSASKAQLSLEKLNFTERLKRQVQLTCVLESLSLAVAAHLCSGVAANVSVTIRSRLRNLLYYNHENCLALLDLVCQRWLAETPKNMWTEPKRSGHCPENLNLDLLIRVKRYRRLRQGEHIMALRQHNEMIANVLRQLCRSATTKRPPLSNRDARNPGDRSPGGRNSPGSTARPSFDNVLSQVSDILMGRPPLDRLRVSAIRQKMLQYMCFKPLLRNDGSEPECPWPEQDPFERYGADQFPNNGQTIWYEPLPPMLPDLEINQALPAVGPDTYTLVLDLDETLVHYFELDGMGNYGIRPGMHEFLQRMSMLGYELVIFTAATQDYADWVIDQIDPCRLIHYRLYRQHALPWGPIFTKDLSRIGRDLDRTLIIDNVQENFMLQPHNGIFICTWYDDPNDTALFALMPLLDELIKTRVKVPEILDKYRDQIPTWAGFDQFSQFPGDYQDVDLAVQDSYPSAGSGAALALQSSPIPYQDSPMETLQQVAPRQEQTQQLQQAQHHAQQPAAEMHAAKLQPAAPQQPQQQQYQQQQQQQQPVQHAQQSQLQHAQQPQQQQQQQAAAVQRGYAGAATYYSACGQHVPWPQHSGYPQAAVPSQVQACHAHTQPAGAARTFAVNGVSGPCQAPVHPQSACQSRIGTSMDRPTLSQRPITRQ
mmetsp:Transcript_17978/g.41677  ORF Transcript_17978/g.41677 Transcript_17978/m.41677 type:complete len:793 (+) Transcript_17978:117-2495(+)